MKIRRRNLILIAAVAGLASGFVIRRARVTSMNSADKAGLPATAARGHQNLSLPARLKEDLAVSSGVAQWLLWMSALENAPLADFPDLARLAGKNAAAQRMIGARWISLNPNNLFETLVATGGEKEGREGAFPRQELGLMLFKDWTQRDPQGAVAALGRKELPPALYYFRFGVLDDVVGGDPELALRASSEWQNGDREYVVDMRFTTKWVAADPRHAAEFALAHPAGHTTRMALEVIGKTWAGSDPEAALTFALNLKDADTSGQGTALASEIVDAWAARDPGKATAWLAAADRTVRNRFCGAMVEAWAARDSTAAMAWIQDNLDGSFRDHATASVLKGVAAGNPGAAAKLVSSMETSTARTRSAASVADKWFPAPGSRKSVPPEAIAWLSSLDPASIEHVLGQTLSNWKENDFKSLADFLVSPAGQYAPSYAFSSAARNMSRKNPVEALAWAGRLPEELRSDAVVSVFSEWQTSQPASAMDWLRKLPAADPRRETFYLAAVRDFVDDDPAATLAARALASGTPDAARATVAQLSIPEERKQNLLNRLQLR